VAETAAGKGYVSYGIDQPVEVAEQTGLKNFKPPSLRRDGNKTAAGSYFVSDPPGYHHQEVELCRYGCCFEVYDHPWILT
jgi:hypothetical protein